MLNIYAGVVMDCPRGCIWTFYGGLDVPMWLEGSHGRLVSYQLDKWVDYWKS